MLEEHGVIKIFEDGEPIFKQGDAGDEMYVVSPGKVKILKEVEDREVALAVLEPKDFFGEIALFGHPRSASAQAMGKTELIALDKNTFLSFINEPLVWNVLERWSERLKNIYDQLASSVIKEQWRQEHWWL